LKFKEARPSSDAGPGTFEELHSALANAPAGGTVELTRDITEPPGYAWYPVTLASGVTIKGGGFKVGEPDDPTRQLSAPLLAGTYAAPIQGVTVDDLTVYVNIPTTGYEYVGGLACLVDGAAFTNCRVYGMIHQNNNYIGGLVGEAHGASSFIGCVNNASVTGVKSTGGIVGVAVRVAVGAPVFRSCVNKGDIYGRYDATASFVGGIVGSVEYGDISNCRNSGSISSQNPYVGGIAGDARRTTITRCGNSGAIVGARDIAAGIAGFATEASNITLCSNSGKIESNGSDVGGIVGFLMNSTIERCTNKGGINSKNDVIPSNQVNVGGIAGRLASSSGVLNSVNEGAVYGYSSVGGIVGSYNDSARSFIVENINRGFVIGTGPYIGGIIGSAFGNIIIHNNSTIGSTGKKVQGERYVGGIVGAVINIPTSPNTGQTVISGNKAGLASVFASLNYAHRILGGYYSSAGFDLLLKDNYAEPGIHLTGDNTSLYGYNLDAVTFGTPGIQYFENTNEVVDDETDPDVGINELNGLSKTFIKSNCLPPPCCPATIPPPCCPATMPPPCCPATMPPPCCPATMPPPAPPPHAMPPCRPFGW
jgi:hypothetical protein